MDSDDSSPSSDESGETHNDWTSEISRRKWLFSLSGAATVGTIGTINRGRAGTVAPGDEQWYHNTGYQPVSSPTVADGTVYVGSEDGNLTAVDAVSGTVWWYYNFGYRSVYSPTVADGTVYIGSDDGNLYGGRHTISLIA